MTPGYSSHKSLFCGIFNKDLSCLLKGLAILLVLICHIGNQFTRFTTPLGGIGVAIFLYLSGYGLTCSFYNSGIKYFWRKRILAVFLPYVCLQLLTFSLHPYTNFTTIILDFALIHPLMPMGWFLNYLLIWYASFWLVMIGQWGKNTRTIILGIFTICLGAITCYYHQSIRFEQSFSFFLGYLIATYDLEELFTIKKGIGALSMGMVLLIIKQFSVISSAFIFHGLLDLGIKFFMLLAVLSFAKRCGIYIPVSLQKGLSYMGLIAFEIYLVQSYMCNLFNYDYPKVLLGIVVFCGSIIFAVLFHYMVRLLRKPLDRCFLHK